MRRLLLILALIAASAGVVTTAASGDDTRTYYVEIDNAFGLVDGSEVQVAGVNAGTVKELSINSDKRAVAEVELSGPLAVLGEDTVCTMQPQSLIAEYFIDCTPKGPPIDAKGSDAEHPDIPVEQTRQTVPQDLVLSTMRAPFRERLTLLINEFGTALAGNADNLNAAIRRGAPALRQTRQVFDLLASQSSLIRDLNVDSDRIISRLAEQREKVVAFINNANKAAATSSEVRDDLSRNFELLDDFLVELKPTMSRLNEFAIQGTPLAADLRAAAPGLTTLSRRLPKFNPSATDALVSLGRASVVGQRALRKGRDEIDQLADAAKNSFSPADNLAKFLRDIDDPNRAVEADRRANRDTGRKGETGYTGMEGLLNYVYYQPGAINQYDEIGHLLHFSIFEIAEGPCGHFNAGEYEGEHGVPNKDGSAATTDILQANRCVAWLGDHQPGISTGPDLPPYDPSVCPNGSTDTTICNPAGGAAAATLRAGASTSGDSASGTDAGAGSTTPGEDGAGTAGGDGSGLPLPDPPQVGGGNLPDSAGGALPDPGQANDLLPRKGPSATDAANANQDLLGYLFGN